MATYSRAYELKDNFRINIVFVSNYFSITGHFKDWALALLGQTNWSDATVVSGLEEFSDHERLFVQAFLQTARLFCELGHLPIFDLPKVVSFSLDPHSPRKYLLEVELFLHPTSPWLAHPGG